MGTARKVDVGNQSLAGCSAAEGRVADLLSPPRALVHACMGGHERQQHPYGVMLSGTLCSQVCQVVLLVLEHQCIPSHSSSSIEELLTKLIFSARACISPYA